MKNKLTWYANRLQSMSNREVLYRIKQHLQSRIEKLATSKNNHTLSANYKQVFDKALENSYTSIPQNIAQECKNYERYYVFGYTIDITKPINWHLDIISNKEFPLSFSKDINIRTEQYGNAKIVWEINRLQFLLPLAIKYSYTQNENDLMLWMNIMKSWITANPYLKGINWYSNIEINIRLIVWYYCWQVLWSNAAVQKNKDFIEFAEKQWLPTIHQHCIYSYKNPSRYSSANNHIIAEYAGLFVASSCWPFTESKKWNKYAKKGLEKQIVLQHSKNGINKEQASEYIQFVTDFLLISLAVGSKFGIDFSDQYKKYLHAICTYILNILDLNGNYIRYGDGDDGKVLITSENIQFNNFLSILTSAAILFKDGTFKWKAPVFDLKNWLLWGNEGQNIFASLTPTPTILSSKFYEEEGHFIIRKTDIEKKHEFILHFNAAPLGFLSIAAHGHADALSILLHINGYPFIIDAGTYTYHTDPEWRKYFVSTAAHNTINIDGKNQAAYKGPTMWLKHYQTKSYFISQHGEFEKVFATHDGYLNLDCKHERGMMIDKFNSKFLIRDHVVVNKKPHQIQSLLLLHPAVQIQQQDAHTFILKRPETPVPVRITFDQHLNTSIIQGKQNCKQGWYSTSFLKKEPTNAILASLQTSHKQELNLKTLIHALFRETIA